MRNIPLEDTSLLSAIQKGDRSAFDVLFQKYYSVLCTYCYRFVEYSLKQYLFKAVYHRCMTRIAQNEVKQRADTAYYERMFAMLQEVDIYQINELSKHIQRAINELPPTYREAFIMHRFQNLSYKEAAELLNVSPKTVDYRIQQALKLLREDLKDYLPLTVLLALHIG